MHRLYGVIERDLEDREYLAGDFYSIADMAAWPWILPEGQGQNLDEFPRLKAWHERVGAREAVKTGRAVGKDLFKSLAEDSEEMKKARDVLFGQRAKS